MTIYDIISLIVALSSFLFTFVTYWIAICRNKKQATLDAITNLQDEVFDNLNILSPKYIQDVASDRNSPEYKRISSYVVRVEHFCVGLNNGIYDKKTFYVLTHGYFDTDTFLNRIAPIIEKKQSNTMHDYYDNIHKVVRWMMKKNNNKKK